MKRRAALTRGRLSQRNQRFQPAIPAETPTIPPAHVLPPENAAEIVLRHGNKLL
jgi:hypothetical protein